MDVRVLGVPVVVLGIISMGIAVLYGYVWPKNRNPGRPGTLRYFILRWMHAIIWALLGISFFVRANPSNAFISDVIALWALPLYMLFVLTMTKEDLFVKKAK